MRITREQLGRIIREEARRLREAAPMRSQGRGRPHFRSGQPDPTAEREDMIDDLSLDPRVVTLHRQLQEIMADGHTIDDVVAALYVLEDPAPWR